MTIPAAGKLKHARVTNGYLNVQGIETKAAIEAVKAGTAVVDANGDTLQPENISAILKDPPA